MAAGEGVNVDDVASNEDDVVSEGVNVGTGWIDFEVTDCDVTNSYWKWKGPSK